LLESTSGCGGPSPVGGGPLPIKSRDGETARRIGIKEKTLRNWRTRGVSPPFLKLGSRVVYRVSDVEAWLATKRRLSTST
jgi:hypothetical protein